jgi:hypothetical protein
VLVLLYDVSHVNLVRVVLIPLQTGCPGVPRKISFTPAQGFMALPDGWLHRLFGTGGPLEISQIEGFQVAQPNRFIDDFQIIFSSCFPLRTGKANAKVNSGLCR